MKDKEKKSLGSIFSIRINLGVLVLLLAACVGVTALVCNNSAKSKFGGSENYERAMKFLEVQDAIGKYYVGDVDDGALSDAAYSAMVQSLGDKWSYYMSADEYSSYQIYSENQYAGIGVTIEQTSDGFRIASVKAGSPAEKAGLQPGEYITAVEDESVTGLKVNEVRNLIASHLNETVNLTVRRLDGSEVTLKVDCAIVYSNPVSYRMLQNNVGYVRIENFHSGSAESAIDAVEALIAQGAAGFVFDVRSNPGGLLSELVKLLDYILPAGDLFVSVDGEGNETVTKSDNVCLSMPMAVLINADSYSAAEFFAAALSEYGWATTVGERTTGKARSQITIELSDGSAVHISSAKYLTPNRVDLAQQGGLRPDLEVAMGENGDAQLDSAVASVLSRG